jgi:hypothetical protein
MERSPDFPVTKILHELEAAVGSMDLLVGTNHPLSHSAVPACAVNFPHHRFRGSSETWPDSGRNQWPGSVGMNGRRALGSVAGKDRNTQPPHRTDPQLSRQQSGPPHRQTARVRGSMRSSFGVSVSITPREVMRIALLIQSETMISLGARAVRHAF